MVWQEYRKLWRELENLLSFCMTYPVEVLAFYAGHLLPDIFDFVGGENFASDSYFRSQSLVYCTLSIPSGFRRKWIESPPSTGDSLSPPSPFSWGGASPSPFVVRAFRAGCELHWFACLLVIPFDVASNYSRECCRRGQINSVRFFTIGCPFSSFILALKIVWKYWALFFLLTLLTAFAENGFLFLPKKHADRSIVESNWNFESWKSGPEDYFPLKLLSFSLLF